MTSEFSLQFHADTLETDEIKGFHASLFVNGELVARTKSGDLAEYTPKNIVLPKQKPYEATYFIFEDGKNLLHTVIGSDIAIYLITSIKKGPIHVQMSISSKIKQVLEDILSNGGPVFTFDEKLYQEKSMNLGRPTQIENMGNVIYNLMLKQRVVLRGETYDDIFTNMFIMVSLLNSPYYRDSIWAINPFVHNEYRIAGMARPLPEPLLEKKQFVKVDLLEKKAFDGKSCPITDRIGEAVQNPSMEKISDILKSTFATAKTAEEYGSVEEFQKEKELDTEDALFYWELYHKIIKS